MGGKERETGTSLLAQLPLNEERIDECVRERVKGSERGRRKDGKRR